MIPYCLRQPVWHAGLMVLSAALTSCMAIWARRASTPCGQRPLHPCERNTRRVALRAVLRQTPA